MSKATDRDKTCRDCGVEFTGHFMCEFCEPCAIEADKRRKRESHQRRKHIYLEKRKQWRKDNPESAKEMEKAFRERNRESVKMAQVSFHKRNPEKNKEYKCKYLARMKAEEPEKLAEQRRRNAEQRDPEKARASGRKSWLKHRDKINKLKRERGYSAGYKARRKDAELPSTCRKTIAGIWKEKCRLTDSTGTLYHVDHIIPLSIGGAHHQDNLRILTATENLKKSKKYDPSLGGVWADNELARLNKKSFTSEKTP